MPTITDVAAQLVAVDRPVMFLDTSNTKDYGEAGSLHPLLAGDFAAVGLRFTTNLPWGLHDVTH